MKKLHLLCIVASIGNVVAAQQKVIQLYEGAAPGSQSWNWNEAENDKNMWQTKVVYNVTKPTLNVFLPETDKANGTAVIICPGGAFYAFANITGTGMDSRTAADFLLNEAGVACLSGAAFGKYGEGYVRFSYANSYEKLMEAVKRIESALVTASAR